MPVRRRRQVQRSEEQVARDEIDAEIEHAIATIAAEWGAAPDAAPVSEDEEVELWGRRDPTVDYDAVYAMLTTTGLPPEMLDPASDLAPAVIAEHPEMAQMYGSVVDANLADMLATLAEHPFRIGLLQDLEDDPEAMVEKANRLDRAWQKQLGGAGVGGVQDRDVTDEQGAPAPEPAMAMMMGG